MSAADRRCVARALFWATVYDHLVKLAGAQESGRRSFLLALAGDSPPTEWRFQGLLGFGGKLWPCRVDGVPYVTCYPEDETPVRLEIIRRVNAELEQLAEAFREFTS